MNAPFRLYGAELSPYSVKVRSYLRYKQIPFEWLQRTAARQEAFARYAKQPLIPVLVDSNDKAMQDSTLIIEALEGQFPEPAIAPEDPALAFVSALLEDYADEWLNKAMFHYRWTYPADQESAAARIVAGMFADAEAPAGLEESVRARMTARLHHVGSSQETGPVIEASFTRLLGLLETMLGEHPYLLGGRPALADFGLACQVGQLLSDPTPGALIRAQAPNVARWAARMDDPKAEGDFVSLASLREGLAALLRSEVAGAYLVWAGANAAAVADDEAHFSVEIDGAMFTQKPQRYAAKALAALQNNRARVGDNAALAALLGESGCDAVLAADAEADGEGETGAEAGRAEGDARE